MKRFLFLALILAIGSVLSLPVVVAENYALPALPTGASSHLVLLKALPSSFSHPAAATAFVVDFAAQYQIRPQARYTSALVGFSATLTPAQVQSLQADPQVAVVELNGVVTISAQIRPTGFRRIGAGQNPNLNIAGNLGHVNADVAVLDTGSGPHNDLRVVQRVNCVGVGISKTACDTTGELNDDNDHGTHVAGIIGAIDNGFGVVGVAPGARIWSVKVLDQNGGGTWESVIAGLDYVAANASAIEVVNMSLNGFGYSAALATAITNAVNKGVVVVVSAGNWHIDAKDAAPANVPDSFVVSAIADFDGLRGGLGSPSCRSDQDDTLANFSNFGSFVDLAAPGTCIMSTVPGNQYSDNWSGTSMAAPHVAGAAALLASRNNPNARLGVEALWNKLKNTGGWGWTDESGDGIKERLLLVNNTTIFNPVLI